MTNKARSILQAVLDKRLTPELWRPYMVSRFTHGDEKEKGCACVLQAIWKECEVQADKETSADRNQYVAMVPVYEAFHIVMGQNSTLAIGTFNDSHTLPEIRSLIQKAIELSPGSDNA